MLGTKCPSMTSKCSQSQPASTTEPASSRSRPKSAANRLGATTTRPWVCAVMPVYLALGFPRHKPVAAWPAECQPATIHATKEATIMNLSQAAVLLLALATAACGQPPIRPAETPAIRDSGPFVGAQMPSAAVGIDRSQ